MTQYEMARIVIRLFAVIAFAMAAVECANTAAQAVQWFMWFRGGPGGAVVAPADLPWILPIALPLVVYVALGVVLWHGSGAISQRVVRDQQLRELTRISPRIAFALGCSLLGFWFAGNAALDVAHWLLGRLFLPVDPQEISDGPQVIGTAIVQGVLGIYLMLGPRGLAGWITRLRSTTGGAHQEPPADSA